MTTLDSVLAIEEGEVFTQQLEAMQSLINSGQAWKLQGSYGRAAMQAIENGDCVLGKVGHKDYWGNYVPSRFEVQEGTKGSLEYAKVNNPEAYEYIIDLDL
jgi:hypothetical protein